MLRFCQKYCAYRTTRNLLVGPFLWLVCLCLSHTVTAQLDATVYEEFNQILLNPYLLNPAAKDTSYVFNFRLNNVNELGLVKNVGRFYLDGDKRIRSQQNRGSHFIGVQMTNTKLGDYINKSRLQFRYAWWVQVSKKASLSSGVSLGFINYAFQTTQGGTGGSDYGPDGSLGLRFNWLNTSVGVALQQVFTPTLLPVNQSFVLERLYNLDVSQKFRLAQRSYLEAQVILQWAESKTSYGFNALLTLKELALIGLSHYDLQKTSMSAGLQHEVFRYYKASLLLSYSINHSHLSYSDNAFELYLSFSK